MSQDPSSNAAQAETPSAHTPKIAASAPNGRPLTGLLGALVAGGIIFLVLDAYYPMFSPPPAALPAGPSSVSDDVRLQGQAAEAIAHFYHALVVMPALGALIGIVLTVLAVRGGTSLKARGSGIVLSVLSGVLFGALASVVGYSLDKQLGSLAAVPSSVAIIAAQGLMLGLMGGGVGLAVGASTRTPGAATKACYHGLLAGVLAGVIYPIAAAGLLPACNIEILVPDDRYAQMLWLGLASGLVGLLVPLGVRAAGPPSRQP